MNAGKDVRDALLIKAMKRWVVIALCPSAANGYPVSKARKNYWYLLRRYPEVASKIGLTATSVL
jgi:hypothetical protein